jgi:hypothetical protein
VFDVLAYRREEMSKLNDLKREHNALLIRGQEAWAEIQTMYDTLMRLQAEIRDIEGDDYDPIPVIFGSGFHIHEDQE